MAWMDGHVTPVNGLQLTQRMAVVRVFVCTVSGLAETF